MFENLDIQKRFDFIPIIPDIDKVQIGRTRLEFLPVQSYLLTLRFVSANYSIELHHVRDTLNKNIYSVGFVRPLRDSNLFKNLTPEGAQLIYDMIYNYLVSDDSTALLKDEMDSLDFCILEDPVQGFSLFNGVIPTSIKAEAI